MESAEQERERQDRERAEDNRARQVRQGVVPAEEESEEGKPDKPKEE